MKKILLLSSELVYQYNEIETPIPPSPNDVTYTRQVAIMEPRPGVTAKDVVEEYCEHLVRRQVSVFGMPGMKWGMNTIGAEIEGAFVQFDMEVFEKTILQITSLMMPAITDPQVRILDKQKLESAVYEAFFKTRDTRKLKEAEPYFMNILKKRIGLV